MKPQFGVCKNKVGCSFAYTGEKIPVPADLKCPECGQPLVIDSPKSGASKMILVLALLLLVIVAGGGAVVFLFKDQIFQLVLHKSETIQKLPDISGEDKGSRPSQSEEQEAATTPSNLSPDTTPDVSAGSEEKGPAATGGPPAPSQNAETEKQKVPGDQTPAPPVTPESPTHSQAGSRSESQPPAAGGNEIQPPATLSKTEVDATREDVLKRINAMPRFTAEEKKRLSEKMQMARSMDRLLVIRFETGQTALSRPAADDLMKRFKSKQVEDKISDPTVVFVVAGYADAAGDPKKNLQISQQRADTVTKALKDRTNLLNVVHSVGMGSTDLLDSKRSDQNRAVEIWAVAP